MGKPAAESGTPAAPAKRTRPRRLSTSRGRRPRGGIRRDETRAAVPTGRGTLRRKGEFRTQRHVARGRARRAGPAPRLRSASRPPRLVLVVDAEDDGLPVRLGRGEKASIGGGRSARCPRPGPRSRPPRGGPADCQLAGTVAPSLSASSAAPGDGRASAGGPGSSALSPGMRPPRPRPARRRAHGRDDGRGAGRVAAGLGAGRHGASPSAGTTAPPSSSRRRWDAAVSSSGHRRAPAVGPIAPHGSHQPARFALP